MATINKDLNSKPVNKKTDPGSAYIDLNNDEAKQEVDDEGEQEKLNNDQKKEQDSIQKKQDQDRIGLNDENEVDYDNLFML